MARTWFAGHPTAPMAPPSRGAASKTSDPAPSNEDVLAKDKVAVKDFASAYPIKASQSASERNGPEIWTTPLSSPQKEPDTQPTKKAIDASANLARLIQQNSTPKEQHTAATPMSQESMTFKPATAMDARSPSLSAPCRAPTAQMVPLPPSAAVTAAPAGITSPAASTASPLGQSPSIMDASNIQALFPIKAPISLPLPLKSSLPSSPIASSEKCQPQKSTPKAPNITLTPAPATAPSAFKDVAFASGVQNTRLLSPARQQTNGIQKRKYTKRSPLKSLSTPESLPEEKRGRGRPRTRIEEQSLEHKKQNRPLVQPATPLNRTGVPDQPSSSLAAPSALPIQQQQAATLKSNRDLTPHLCSEDPRLWPERGDYVSSLYRFHSRPAAIHSEPVQACANCAAHQDQQSANGHRVCITCRSCAHRHLRATRPELLGSAWWPLCKTCSHAEMSHMEPSRKGCSCWNKWLCFSCLTEEVEKRSAKNSVEAEFRRRNFVGKGMDGNVKTVITGWVCECGKEIGSGTTLMRCVGCRGMRTGKFDPQEAASRAESSRKTALAWT